MEKEQLIELIQSVSSSKLTEFQYEENGIKIGMKKNVRLCMVWKKSCLLHR